jgi:selenocysteine-specific elongation factor
LLATGRPLKNFSKVRFHQGTAEVLARVALLGRSSLGPGEQTVAQLRLERPAFCLHGDAFIIRQFSPAATIGGGRVLNPQAAKHKVTDRQAAALLQRLEAADLAEKVPILIAMHPKQMMGLKELNAALGLPETLLRDSAAKAAASARLVMVPGPAPILIVPPLVEKLKKTTAALVAGFQRENPLVRGISREELRKRVYDGLPSEIFRFCLEQLSAERVIAAQEDIVALYGTEVQLPPAAQRIKEAIEEILSKAGWQPPSLPEMTALVAVDPAEARKICAWMLKEKILVRISEDIVYHRTTIAAMKEKIHGRFQAGSRFGVAEFKELFNLTRKHAIPLLEYLDRERFTRRQGSERILL